MGIALNLQIAFGKMAIVTILILKIQEHGRFFHLLRSPWNSSFKDLKFLSYRTFTCLDRVTPRYFILSVAIGKGFTFEYRKATDLLELIFYPVTLLKLFTSCRSSLVEFWVGLSILSYHLKIVIS